MNDFELVVLSGRRNRCQHLNMDGVQCKRLAKYRRGYHGDAESYTGDDTQWVSVELCGVHAKDTFNLPEDLSQLPKVKQ